MKKINTLLLSLLISSFALSQQKDRSQLKGKFFSYWGWNRGLFTNSNIHFKGDNYKFTLHQAKALDKQSPFNFDVYFNPLKLSIPQYNFRLGYYITNKYNISIGQDHMKYVVTQNQIARISGDINNGSAYDGIYNNDNIKLTKDFLQLEHTDGLNYANIALGRTDLIKSVYEGKVKLNLVENFGLGLLVPRTDATLLNYKRHDKFHLAGYGTNLMLGANITLWDVFFIQSEFKGGFINLPWIRTTFDKADSAKQNFFFFQRNILFGFIFNLNTANK